MITHQSTHGRTPGNAIYLTVLLLCALVCGLALEIEASTIASESIKKATANDDPANTLYFWHMTDPHLDPHYLEGSDPDCDYPMCCREMRANQTRSAGKYGFIGRCDIPVHTFTNALEFVSRADLPSKPLFVLFGGDNPDHSIWKQSAQYCLDVLRTTYSEALYGAFPPESGVPVFGTIGNHDSFPVDELDLPSTPNARSFLEPFTDIALAPWLANDPSALESARHGGYYSTLVRPGLRVISVNTQYCDPLNFYLLKSKDKDPAQMGAFLERELEQAEKNGERVIYTGHIPPGITSGGKASSTYNWNTILADLMERYSKTVVGQFYGHTHKDSFIVFRDKKTYANATSVAFVTPAVTPFSDQYPAVRLVKLDASTYELLDIVTFYSNMTEANKSGQMTWKVEYSMKDTYGLKDLTPRSMFALLKRLETDSKAWDTFALMYHVLHNRTWGRNPTSKKKQLCKMGYVDYLRFTDCVYAKK